MITHFTGNLSQGTLPHSLRVKGELDEELDAAGDITSRKGRLAWQDAIDLAPETDYRLDLDGSSFYDICTTNVDNTGRRAEFFDISKPPADQLGTMAP